MSLRLFCLSTALLFLAAGCDNKLVVEGVDLSMESAQFGFHSAFTQDFDVNADGYADVAVSYVSLVVTDSEDLCDSIQRISDLDHLDDVRALQLAMVTVGGVDMSTYTTNTSLSELWAAPTAGQTVVSGRLLQRAAGVTVLDAYTANALDPNARDDGELGIDSMGHTGEVLTSIGGDLSLRLVADLSPSDALDLDLNGDGAFDASQMDAVVSGSFRRAEACDTLNL